MVSNAIIFLAAGFDTTSNIQSVAMHLLAKNPKVQDQLFEEIRDAIDKAGSERLSYDAIHGMEYLDMVIHEALRHWVVLMIDRQCTKVRFAILI